MIELHIGTHLTNTFIDTHSLPSIGGFTGEENLCKSLVQFYYFTINLFSSFPKLSLTSLQTACRVPVKTGALNSWKLKPPTVAVITCVKHTTSVAWISMSTAWKQVSPVFSKKKKIPLTASFHFAFSWFCCKRCSFIMLLYCAYTMFFLCF